MVDRSGNLFYEQSEYVYLPKNNKIQINKELVFDFDLQRYIESNPLNYTDITFLVIFEQDNEEDYEEDENEKKFNWCYFNLVGKDKKVI